jgi:hypothetical protein
MSSERKRAGYAFRNGHFDCFGSYKHSGPLRSVTSAVHLCARLKVAVRIKVLIVVIGCFVAHTIEVWLYAVAFLLIFKSGLGSLKGHQVDESFADFLYFSATSYSTMGIGDIYPSGALRLVSGIEGINGLFLIAWSTSFTYFVMDRLWPLHPDRSQG